MWLPHSQSSLARARGLDMPDLSLCYRRRAEERWHYPCPVANREDAKLLGGSKFIQTIQSHGRTFSCSRRWCLFSVSERHQVVSAGGSIPASESEKTR